MVEQVTHFVAEVNRQALRNAMEFHGFSRRKTALLAGVSAASVGNLAGGYRAQCSADTARKIAKALGVPTTSLFLLKPVRVADTGTQRKKAA